MIILAGSVRIAQGTREAMLPLIEAMIAATRAEPGCIDYAFSFDVQDEHRLRIFEVFEDGAALAAHRGSAHMAQWRARAAQLGVHGRDIREFTVSAQQSV